MGAGCIAVQQACGCCSGTGIQPATPQYTYDSISQWGLEVWRSQRFSLLGCWATAPIPEDFTFGVELELAVHSVESGRQGKVQMAHSTMWRSSSRDSDTMTSVLNYLYRMGVIEGWK
jgi:hypothetical protein